MKAKDALIAAVNDHGLMRDLDPRYLHKLAALALEAHFAPEQVIFKEEDTTRLFYLILSGSVVLEIAGSASNIETEIRNGGDGMGWSALLGYEPKHLQARALTDVRVLAFEGKRLRKACENDPAFGCALMKRLSEVHKESALRACIASFRH
jgi:CRP/FNR family transcriptional regulator, cyclic AMP receptor protein